MDQSKYYGTVCVRFGLQYFIGTLLPSLWEICCRWVGVTGFKYWPTANQFLKSLG